MAVDYLTQFLEDGMGKFSRPGIEDTRPVINIDFTTEAAGAAPVVDDNGHAAFIRFTSSTGRAPKIVSGKLVADPTSNSGYATYWQVPEPSGLNMTRVGAEFTVAVNDGGVTAATVALWDEDFDVDAGTPVPQTRAHLVIIPGTGAWNYYVGDDGNGHLVSVANGTFATQPFDGVSKWSVDMFVDEDRNSVEILLPDSTVVTITAAQIAAAIAGATGWIAGTTVSSLSGKFAVLEHYAFSGSLTNVAAFPQFTSFWAERNTAHARRFVSPSTVAEMIQAAKALSPVAMVEFAPTGADIAVPFDAFTDIDTSGVAVTVTIPEGYTAAEVDVSGFLSISSATRVIWALREGATPRGTLSVVDSASFNGVVRQTFKVPGLSPGAHTFVVQHFATATGAVLKLDIPNGYAMSVKATPLVS